MLAATTSAAKDLTEAAVVFSHDADLRTATGYSIDSRTVAPGDLFFAIRGPNHDGHNYIDSALGRGASGAVAAFD